MMRNLFGSIRVSNMRLKVVYYDKDKHIGVVLCMHTYVDEVRLALAALSEINGQKILPYVVKVVGSRLKAIEFCKGFNHPLLKRLELC